MATAPHSPLVGRDRALGILRARLTAALGGSGHLVLIGGEAGIGKTTLADELCREAAREGALVLVGRCFDRTETPAYGPWLYLFERYDCDGGPSRPAAFSEPGQVGEVASQAALFRQVLDFFKALAIVHPLVLLLDDLHWADSASLDLLRFLAQSVATMRMLVLVTFRSDEVTRSDALYQLLPALVREADAARVDLVRLGDGAVRVLVVERYRLPDADTDRLVLHLQARAEGNPLFVGELLRSLEETGVLRRDGETWVLGELTHETVPSLLRQVIDGRVARLDEDAQRLLAVAAIIGHEVPLGVLATVAAVCEEGVMAFLTQGIEAHLLVETPDGERMRFAHALVREALYEGMLAMRRRHVHRRAAEALAALPVPDADAIAHHFRQAGDMRAVEWLIQAGERAQRAYAWLTAAQRYEAAIAATGTQGAWDSTAGWLRYRLARMLRYSDPTQGIVHLDEAERAARACDDRALIAATQYFRGLLRVHGGERAHGLAEMIEASGALAALSTDEQDRLNANDDTSRGEIRSRQGTAVFYLAVSGRLAEAVALGEETIRGLSDDPAAVARAGILYGDALRGLGTAYMRLGRVEDARSMLDHARAVFRAAGHHANLAQTIYTVQWYNIYYHADRLGERERLEMEVREVVDRSRGSGFSRLVTAVSPNAAFVAGDWEGAQRVAGDFYTGAMPINRFLFMEVLAALARERGDSDAALSYVSEMLPQDAQTEPGNIAFGTALALQRLGAQLALDARDPSGARQWLAAYDRWLGWSGAVLGRSEREALWAEYHRQAGDSEQAYEHAARAHAHATEPRQPLALLVAHRLLGELDTEAHRFADAQAHLDTALALAAACAAPYERALTLLALAEMRGATDDRAAVITLLDEVRAICTPLGAKPALARANTLAARQQVLKERAPVHPAGLSTREVEVLKLLTAGHTNREIGDVLFLSENTVRVHVRHIFEKTRTDNRTGAALFARAHGLA